MADLDMTDRVRTVPSRNREARLLTTSVCSEVNVQPFHVAANTCPHDGQPCSPVSLPGTHTPSN